MAAIGQEEKMVYYEEIGLTQDHLLTFLDAIFSIAVTLLVLEIRIDVPLNGTDSEIIWGLIAATPAIVSYVISFFVIASFWMYAHNMFHYINKINRRFALLTLVFLFFIAFMPFPTLVLGQHTGRLPAVVFYCASISISSIIMYLMWHCACSSRLVDERIDAHFKAYKSARILSTTTIFLTSIPIAFINPLVAQYWWVLVPIASRATMHWYNVKAMD